MLVSWPSRSFEVASLEKCPLNRGGWMLIFWPRSFEVASLGKCLLNRGGWMLIFWPRSFEVASLGKCLLHINNKKYVHHGFLAPRPYLCSTSLNAIVFCHAHWLRFVDRRISQRCQPFISCKKAG